jgi:tetratricopeptide (TPR) repeat protein
MHQKRHVISLLGFLIILLLSTGCTDREEVSRDLVKQGKKKLSMGLNEEAIAIFDKAISKNPENAEAWYYHGNCKVSMGSAQEAIEDFSEAIRLKPDYSAAYFNRGQAWFYLHDQTKACEDWKKAEELGFPNISDRTRHCP